MRVSGMGATLARCSCVSTSLTRRCASPYRTNPMSNHYRILGVSRFANRDEIRRSGELPDSNEADCRFPSMLRIVPRIIGAFLGASEKTRDMHSKSVDLSPREALEGARIPVELPVRPTCPVCGGRGETWAEPCGVCVGTGSGQVSHELELPVPPGVRHGTRLKFSVTPPYAPETHVELRIAIR